jgi:hypothetical protein
MKYLIALVVSASFLSSAFLSSLFLSSNAVASPAPEQVEFFSFEQDFEGWTPASILTSGSTASVSRSQDRAIDGETSVKLDVQSPGEVPEAAVWIQKEFTLAPNETYQVQVRYFLATADGPLVFGGTEAMIGAIHSPPATLKDALTFLHDRVRSDKPPRYRWLRKEYELTAQTDDAGSLSIMTGVIPVGVITSYYIDGITIKFTRREAGSVQPIISSVSRVGKRLMIEGSAFGPSPRVTINDVDRSDLAVVSTDNSITLRGSLAAFGFLPYGDHNAIRVVDDRTAAASDPFDFNGHAPTVAGVRADRLDQVRSSQ